MYVLTGVAVWALARGAGWGADVSISHIGASGVAYALVSFLFWFGLFKRSIQSIIVALVILLYFSGMIAGVLPDQINVSWESHLLGGVVGMFVAWRYRGCPGLARPGAQEADLPKRALLPGGHLHVHDAGARGDAAGRDRGGATASFGGGRGDDNGTRPVRMRAAADDGLRFASYAALCSSAFR